ncbi:hyaluronan and proteoglycan link protein 1-like [Porites lutea]|uniref:hyaluronan and proteoglycan link protein 1-like n=1 Tax=Porites lutea TaxID=51062 RepID=UPI003CC53538
MVSSSFNVGLRKWLVLLSLLVLVQPYLTRERQFYKIEGKSLLGNVTAVTKVKDFFRCCFLCMEYGPVACLSFNLERSNNSGIHTCELSSSEKYLEPQKMQRRLDYDYYGTEFQNLVFLRPCILSPCNFGGTCTEGPGLGEYSCQCKPEISVLPFIDNRCNVDTNKTSVLSPTKGVFWGAVTRYNLNYYDARRFCELLGATIATYHQLYVAWEAGLEHCKFGWLSDSTFRYPMHQKHPQCGNKIGILGSSKPQNKTIKRDVWCYKQT